jgi:hypothetical protein
MGERSLREAISLLPITSPETSPATMNTLSSSSLFPTSLTLVDNSRALLSIQCSLLLFVFCMNMVWKLLGLNSLQIRLAAIFLIQAWTHKQNITRTGIEFKCIDIMGQPVHGIFSFFGHTRIIMFILVTLYRLNMFWVGFAL